MAGANSIAGNSNTGAAATGGSGGNTTAPGCGDEKGFYVEDGKLFDKNCNEFVMRGVNYPYAWYASRNTQQDFAAIAATGANAVRIVLSSGEFCEGTSCWTKTTAANLTSLINWAKAAKLVSLVEVHDTTGYSEKMGAVPLANATNYWMGAEIANVLKGQEAFVIINIGNEPNGNNTGDTWAPTHVTAVQALRNAGFEHTLIIDAPAWGQDWENTMRDGGGSSIWQADTKKNLIFSVHMYDVYNTANKITDYFKGFLDKYEAPLIIGEFAADHGKDEQQKIKEVDEDTILAQAEMLGLGYLGWSWSGNGGGLESLDLTQNFDAASLTTWGTRLINGANGIKMTSTPCTCFN